MPTNMRRNLAVSIDPNSGVPALNVDVNGPRRLPANIALGTAGYNNAVQFVGRGGVPPYAFAVTTGALPTGLSLNPTTGVVTGTPTVQGTAAFVLTITDNVSTAVPHAFAFDVFGNLYPVLGHVAPTAGVRQSTYSYQILFADATGSTAGITYAVLSGALPGGVTMSTAGLLTASSISAAAGTYNFTVRGTKGSATLDMPMQMVVRAALGVLSAAISIGGKLRNMVAGVPVDDYISVTGLAPPYGTPPYTWTITAGALPAGLSMDSTGHVTGTPTTATPNTYVQPTFTATDAAGDTRSLTPTTSNGVNVNSSLKAAIRGTLKAAGSDGLPTDVNLIAAFLSDGSDGDFICNGSNTCPGTNLSGGVNFANRDLFLNSLTSVAGGRLEMGGYALYILNGHDITNAPVGAVTCNGANGVGLVGGIAGQTFATSGANGVAGAVGAGVAGVAPSGVFTLGGGAGSGFSAGAHANDGKGGAGTAGASGSAGALTSGNVTKRNCLPIYDSFISVFPAGTGTASFDPIWGGLGGASGSPGAGSGAAVGGNSGSGGAGAGRLIIRAGWVTIGPSTPAGCIQAIGGNGSVGVAGGGTGRGGGGGGFGGGGGQIRYYYGNIYGTNPGVSCLWADGGNGANGGNAGGGAGTVGFGGGGGYPGMIQVENILGALSQLTSGGGPPAVAGQTGVAGVQCRAPFL